MNQTAKKKEQEQEKKKTESRSKRIFNYLICKALIERQKKKKNQLLKYINVMANILMLV